MFSRLFLVFLQTLSHTVPYLVLVLKVYHQSRLMWLHEKAIPVVPRISPPQCSVTSGRNFLLVIPLPGSIARMLCFLSFYEDDLCFAHRYNNKRYLS